MHTSAEQNQATRPGYAAAEEGSPIRWDRVWTLTFICSVIVVWVFPRVDTTYACWNSYANGWDDFRVIQGRQFLPDTKFGTENVPLFRETALGRTLTERRQSVPFGCFSSRKHTAIAWLSQLFQTALFGGLFLGVQWARGEGISWPRDWNRLKIWRRHHADSLLILACGYWIGLHVPQNFTVAAKLFRKAAERGNAEAQWHLGEMYAAGQGMPCDDVEAAKWFLMAADNGDAVAQLHLGYLHRIGRGVRQDYTEAVHWYRKAAEQGCGPAQHELGCLHTEGLLHNPVQAYKWVSLAVLGAKGDQQKKFARTAASIEMELTSYQLAEARRLVNEWRPRISRRRRNDDLS